MGMLATCHLSPVTCLLVSLSPCLLVSLSYYGTDTPDRHSTFSNADSHPARREPDVHRRRAGDGRAARARGVRVQRMGDSVRLVSAPASAAAVERFLGVQAPPRLSAAALEALAIIAYRQPITRAQVEAIRGVDSSGVIRALLGRDLIAEAGRLESVGRPILYATTDEFLRQFGLSSLAELPPLDLPEVG